MRLATQRLGSTALSLMLLSSLSAEPRSALDDAVDRAFAGQPGAGIVINVRDSRVLAAHNLPELTGRIAAPGSAIKPFVLQLLLETGAIAPQDSIACRRHLTIAGRNLNCSHPPEYATFHAEEALALSCNTYFVTAAERLKPGELERRLRETRLHPAVRAALERRGRAR